MVGKESTKDENRSGRSGVLWKSVMQARGQNKNVTDSVLNNGRDDGISTSMLVGSVFKETTTI